MAFVTTALLGPAEVAFAAAGVSLDPKPGRDPGAGRERLAAGQELVVSLGTDAYPAVADSTGSFEVPTGLLVSNGPPLSITVRRADPSSLAFAHLGPPPEVDVPNPFALLFAESLAMGARFFGLHRRRPGSGRPGRPRLARAGEPMTVGRALWQDQLSNAPNSTQAYPTISIGARTSWSSAAASSAWPPRSPVCGPGSGPSSSSSATTSRQAPAAGPPGCSSLRRMCTSTHPCWSIWAASAWPSGRISSAPGRRWRGPDGAGLARTRWTALSPGAGEPRAVARMAAGLPCVATGVGHRRLDRRRSGAVGPHVGGRIHAWHGRVRHRHAAASRRSRATSTVERNKGPHARQRTDQPGAT